MVTVLRGAAVAALLLASLVGCSGDGTPGATPSPTSRSSPGESASSAAGDAAAACAALADVKRGARTLRQDVADRDLAAVRTDVSGLQQSFDRLFSAASDVAGERVDDVRSAWRNLQTAASDLVGASLAQAKKQLGPAIQQVTTAVDGLGESLDCGT